METHGGSDVFESHIQKTREDYLTKTFRKISKPSGLSKRTSKNSTTNVETSRYVGS